MKIIISTLLSIILLSGCGAEIAYKRGATAQDLKAGKAACQKANTEQALNQCLEDNGWAIQKLDGGSFTDDELFATASVAKDNRMIEQEENDTSSIKTTESLKAQETPKTTGQPNIETTVTKETSSKSISKPEEKAIKPQPSIFDTYVIKSWWKMGGNLTLLNQNMDECKTQLGEAHTPNKKTFTFTRGFAICMRQKGWRGLIEK